MTVREILKSHPDWTWIYVDGDFPEKHDILKNERNGQSYYVHTDDPYENKWAIWTGSNGPDIDLLIGDTLIVKDRIVGEYE